MTEIAAAARRTLRAGSARIRYERAGGAPATAHEGVADLARRRVRLAPVGGGATRVYGDGTLRHETADGTWTLDRRPGSHDPLAILDRLTTAVSRPLDGEDRDVRGVACERLDFRTAGDPLVLGRAWVGPDDRLRRIDWPGARGRGRRLELWDFGVAADVALPAAVAPPGRLRSLARRLRPRRTPGGAG